MKPRFRIALLFVFGALVCLCNSCKVDKKEFTLLAWVGYDEEDLKVYLEKTIDNLSISVITYTGGEDMLNKYLSNKDGIDLIVVDAEYGKLLLERGELKKFSLSDMPDAKVNVESNYFEKFKNNSSEYVPGYDEKSDSLYCFTVRWGTVGIVADTSLNERIDSIGYSVLYNPLEGKSIPIFDWYLPNMGVFSLMYLDSIGVNKNPYDLTSSELNDMYENIMRPIGNNITGFYGDLGIVINNIFEPESYASPGIGEWAIGNSMLSGVNNKMDWYIPKEGGIMWIEALAIPASVEDDKLDLAYQLMNEFSKPELQAMLAWRNAYTSHVPNKKAYALMSDEQKAILKYNEIDEIVNLLHYRKLPDLEIRKEWINYWTKYKSGQ